MQHGNLTVGRRALLGSMGWGLGWLGVGALVKGCGEDANAEHPCASTTNSVEQALQELNSNLSVSSAYLATLYTNIKAYAAGIRGTGPDGIAWGPYETMQMGVANETTFETQGGKHSKHLPHFSLQSATFHCITAHPADALGAKLHNISQVHLWVLKLGSAAPSEPAHIFPDADMAHYTASTNNDARTFSEADLSLASADIAYALVPVTYCTLDGVKASLPTVYAPGLAKIT